MAIVRKSWPLGWCPTDAEFGGRVQGLTRMENLGFDRDGSVSPLFGTTLESGGAMPSGIRNIYSKVFNLQGIGGGGYPTNAKVRYVAMDTGQVLRNYGPSFKSLTAYEISILTGGAPITSFGFAKGWTLICSGTKNYKDNGIIQLPLGLNTPNAPGAYGKYPNTIYAGNLVQGPILSIISATNAGNVVFTTSGAHGFVAGVSKIRITGLTGNWDSGNNDWVVESTPSGSTFTIALDSNSFGALTGSGIVFALVSYNNWDINAVEGSGYNKASTYIQVTADSTSYRGIVQAGKDFTFTEDLTKFKGITGLDTGEDIFKMDIRISDTTKLIKFRLEILLDTPTSTSTTPDVGDYFWFEWEARNPNQAVPDSTDPTLVPYYVTPEQAANLAAEIPSGVEFVGSFRQGLDTWSTLLCKRNQFNRVGNDQTRGWQNVKGYRMIVLGIDGVEITATNMSFTGGNYSTLSGTYSIIQVDVYNAGTFQDKSPASNPSVDVTVYNSTIRVTPNAASPGASEIWLYIAGGSLDGYYRFAVITTNLNSPRPVDIVSNETDLKLDNTTLEIFLERLPENIIDIVDDFFDRTLYFTADSMYPSYTDNPGGYDGRFVYKIASIEGEVILWAKKVSNSSVLVGTTKEIYELTGSGGEIEISPGVIVLDYQRRSLGVSKPPVSKACAVNSGSIVYYANDGWRVLQGTNGTLIDELGRMNLLYNTQKDYQDATIYSVRKNYYDDVYASCTFRGNKLYFGVERLVQGRYVQIFDLQKNYWTYKTDLSANNAPQAMFTEEDGTVIYGTTSAGDKFIRSYNFSAYTIDGSFKQPFVFETTFDDLDMPIQRKDAFTLSVDLGIGNDLADTATVTIIAFYDNFSKQTLTFTGQVFGARSQFYYNISSLGTPKKFKIRITATATDFNLYSLTLDVNPRPEQRKYLRIPNSNFGVQGRKRVPEIPINIDTLGNTVGFRPLIDNVLQPNLDIVTNEKLTVNYQFPSDVLGRDVGGILTAVSGVFEFYDMVQPREIEVLPDSLKFKHIPYTNLGTSSRKRFIQFAFVINTNGSPVMFSPVVDGVPFAAQMYTTSRRQTVIYTFAVEATGVDIGGTLSGTSEFEYYGVNLDDCLSEKLPAAAKFLVIPTTNFGTAGKKRIRTIPLVIDTKGQDVVFTPTVDGVAQPSTTFNTTGKRTVFYYFETDVFGVDYGGTLKGAFDFEFYSMLTPENVETLPVGKMLDQIGLLELSRIGNLYMLYVRLYATGFSIQYRIYVEESNQIHSGTFSTTPDTDTEYTIKMPHFIKGKVFRIELQSTSIFHRWSAKVEYSEAGNDTQHKRKTFQVSTGTNK